MIDNARAVAIIKRRRSLWTGSAEAFVHDLQDSVLERVAWDPNMLAYERNPTNPHTYPEGSIERAAAAELAWRRQAGICFGWSRC